jgi:phosphoserine phosphatase
MAERLAAVETAEEGRAAVESAGGIEQVRTLCERLDADRERLERIENRRTAFDQRLAGVEVPLSALERLA